MTLTPLQTAILKVLGEKPLEHQDIFPVCRKLRQQNEAWGVVEATRALCQLERMGQIVMIDGPDTMTAILTPSGRITALGARLGICSVMLNPAEHKTVN